MPGPSALHRYEFDPQAEEEFVQTLHLYEKEAGSRVADAFEEEVSRSIGLILRYPKISPAIGVADVRCKILRGFPYVSSSRLERRRGAAAGGGSGRPS